MQPTNSAKANTLFCSYEQGKETGKGATSPVALDRRVSHGAKQSSRQSAVNDTYNFRSGEER